MLDQLHEPWIGPPPRPISRRAVADDLDAGRLALLDIEPFPRVRPGHLVRNPDRDTALQRALAAFLLENVRLIVDCPPDPADEGESLRDRVASANEDGSPPV